MITNKPFILSKRKSSVENNIHIDAAAGHLIINMAGKIQTHKIENGTLDLEMNGLHIHAYSSMPGTQKITPASHTLIISGQGFHSQKWHDGPLIYFNNNGFVESYVPCGKGYETQISSDNQESELSFSDINLHEISNLISSIEVSIQDQYKANIECLLTVPTKSELLYLLLAVRALGADRVKCIAQKPSPQIKRLCQNLGISLKTDTSERAPFDVAVLQALGTEESLGYLNDLTRILDSFHLL